MINVTEEYIKKFSKRYPNKELSELVTLLSKYHDDSKQLTRTINGLLRQRIQTVDELMETDVKKIRNLGEVSLNAIRQAKGEEVKPIVHKVYLKSFSDEELIQLRKDLDNEFIRRFNNICN